jgi:hypothetical protein
VVGEAGLAPAPPSFPGILLPLAGFSGPLPRKSDCDALLSDPRSIERHTSEQPTALVTVNGTRGQRGGPAAHVLLDEHAMIDAMLFQPDAQGNEFVLCGNGEQDEIGVLATNQVSSRGDAGVNGLHGLMAKWKILTDDDVHVGNLPVHDRLS